MKKLLMTVLMLVGVATFASVQEPFKQFTRADYTSEQRLGDLNASQNTTQAGDWYTSQLISLHVQAGSSVWLTHKISSWYWCPDLHGSEFDMVGGNRYGYILKDAFDGDLTREKGTYDNLIHWSDGKTAEITYINDAGWEKVTTTGYLLDEFKEDTDIYLVMTALPADGNETVDTYQYVQSAGHADTTLVSRTYDYDDQAGNVVINFGFDAFPNGREFVAIYNTGDSGSGIIDGGGTTGGPLPGVFFAGLLSLGTVFGASKAKRQKRA